MMLYRQFSQIDKKANASNDRWAKTINTEKKPTKKITFHHIRNPTLFNTHLSAHYVLAMSPLHKQRGNKAPAIHSSGTHRTPNGKSARKTIKEVIGLEVTGRVFLDHQGSWVSTSDTWMKSSQPRRSRKAEKGLWSLEELQEGGQSQSGWSELSLTAWETEMKRLSEQRKTMKGFKLWE